MRKLAYCAGGFSAAIFLAHFLLPARWVLPGALAAVVLALVTLLLPGQTRRRVMAALLSAAIGFGWYAAASALRLTPVQNVSGDVQTVTARVTEYPVAYARSYGLTALLTSPDVPSCKARLYVSDADAAALRPGDEITADVKFRPSTLRYGEETDAYITKGIYLIGSVRDKTLARTGVWSRSWLYWPKTVAQSLKTSAQAAFPADVLPFAQALMLGDKSALYAQDLDIPLSTTGIMHTVAVSGLHLAFLLGFLRLFTGNRRMTAIIGLPMMVVFVVMAGCSPSVLRAAFMTALVLFAPLLGRENDPPTSLLTALAILLTANPFAAASISLQLSFASMAGLFCVSGALYRALDARLLPADVKLSRPRRKIRAFFSATTASSVGAMVFTVPLTALHFGNISLIAPVTNLLILWLLPAAFIGCYLTALLGLVWAWGGTALAWVTAWPLRYILAVANVLSKLPVRTLVIPAAADITQAPLSDILALAEANHTTVVRVDAQQTIAAGGISVRLYPEPCAGQEDGSMIVLASIGDYDTLVPGDVDTTAEAKFLSTCTYPDIELLFVGHHGSKRSTGDAWLDAIAPDVAIISVGYNSYGHPTSDTLERLQAHHIPIYRTDQMGDITVHLS